MFTEDELLPLSGLQHLRFCERQWGLIHIEQQWDENRLTVEGRLLHEHVHETGAEARPGLVIARGLSLRSLTLGLIGQADVVEFHEEAWDRGHTVKLAGREGHWRPFPVEYKRGRPKAESSDEVQLCAQALCLEEMLDVRIETGALFYGQTRRRKELHLGAGLREETVSLAARMHELYSKAITPRAVYLRKCERCSLKDVCLPRQGAETDSVARWMARALKERE